MDTVETTPSSTSEGLKHLPRSRFSDPLLSSQNCEEWSGSEAHNFERWVSNGLDIQALCAY